MEPHKSIGFVTLLLAAVAGYCDALTFIAGDSIFSAHVTGNFIVFAAQAVLGAESSAWMKLLTFPVFVFAVMAGGWMAEKLQNRYLIIWIESLLLLIGGGIALVSSSILPVVAPLTDYGVVMIAVFAMGLQNAFGKLFAKETHGPTTMMTGNVTQASLDLGSLLRKGTGTGNLSQESLKKQMVLLGGFLGGCFVGAMLAQWIGLTAIMLPGAVLFLFRMFFLRPQNT